MPERSNVTVQKPVKTAELPMLNAVGRGLREWFVHEFREKLENRTQIPLESPTGSAETLPQAKRLNQGSKYAEASSVPSLVTPPNESSHRTEDARQLIQNELEHNDGMAKDRKNVLRSALDFVSGFSHAPHASQPSWNDLDLAEDLVFGSTAPEMLYMMLPGIIDEHEYGSKTIHWPDHITGPTLQKMLLYLIDDGQNDKIALHYRVCVYSKAFFFLMKSHFQHNDAIFQRLKQSQREYKNIALASLARLTFLSPPCLSLVQALLSGAMLMQYLGNMSYSWNLTAFASRILMSLNFHTVEATYDLDDETRASLYWCYYLDRVLSCLFVRQPSLPKLHIDPASMVPVGSQNPFHAMVKIMVEMAKFQEQVLDMQLNQEALADNSRVDTIAIGADSLLDLIKETRSSMPPELRPDFDAAEFGHAAVLSNAFKCSRWNSSHQQRCLESARKALIVLAAMLDREDQSDTADQYPSFLTWTVLLFPLTPFFVLFCNVVASSHRPDYDLMLKITECLARFAHLNEWIHRVHALCHHFLILCDPLMGQTVSNLSITHDSGFLPGNDCHLEDPGTTEESLIWELFDFQPSLDWLDMPSLQNSFAN
ncbi:hypothetical protein P170DRAFT_513133 [Aspergillus steynii IBT 23096]|uniref:Xylanolytic transcriptional activator regulatory domain-containing protein n=1 Tax=Aspergillus steynii IBT 23096 TaxID=1392250 RepID=A0A2I2FWP7_9EURO|nr:uncharacterized protein P170DRAFT_513133 [Aspergillus steynii IBT 23096]PLB45069.1 hypothetical protein P170DRAFT_513133 [Aspergillus steynii IBT 23096]